MKNRLKLASALLLAAAGVSSAAAAEVTVIRPAAFIAQEWPVYVIVGDKAVADLLSGERVTIQVPAGTRSIAVHCPKGMGSAYAESRIERDFSAPTNLVLTARQDCVAIDVADPAEASRLVSRTRARLAGRPVDYVKPSVVYPTKGFAAADAAPVTTPAAATPAPTTSEAGAREAIASATSTWVEAFNGREAPRLLSLYEPDAVLTDTSESKPRVGRDAIADYYGSLVKRPTQRVALGERTIRVFGDTAIDAGNLTYFEMRDGAATTTPGRYSITYRHRGGRWLIVDHHTSVLPR